MILTQLPPQPLRVIVEPTDGAKWWEVMGALGPLAVLLAAVITGAVAWKSVRQSQKALEQEIDADRRDLAQRSLADQKAQWWERVQWALDASFSGDTNRKAAGIAMVRVLSEPEWLTAEELLLLDAAWREGLEPIAARGARIQSNAEDQRVRVEAARLRVALDQRLGRSTPQSIEQLAHGMRPV